MNGGLLFAGIIYLTLYISKIVSKDPYQIVLLIFVLSIAIGIHGISHVGLESVYNYNPLSIFNTKQSEPYHPIDCPYRRHCNCPYGSKK